MSCKRRKNSNIVNFNGRGRNDMPYVFLFNNDVDNDERMFFNNVASVRRQVRVNNSKSAADGFNTV